MSALVAAGWARSRFQSVSVVPMIQCVPHGMTNSTDFSVRRMIATSLTIAVARHHDVHAFGGPHPEPAALLGQRLDLVGPHPGGVDHDVTVNLGDGAVLGVADLDTR